MTGASTFLMLSSLLAVALVWALPRRHGLDAVAILTLVSLSVLSPASALWLGCTTLTTVLTIRHYQSEKYRGIVVAIYSTLLVSLLFISREMVGFFWIGGAYFTLRHLHVLVDWWMGRLAIPTTVQYLKYSFFLPVLMAGPIHRLDNFQRQVHRQRITTVNLFNGAERGLFGLAQAVVISSWGLRRLQDSMQRHTESLPMFFQRWIEGAFDWLQMFFSFSGLTSLALGLSLMIGIKIEENFNRPWAAKNLIDFWSRWHMTLSNWCRDYVFHPVTAIVRKPTAGLLMAMLAMGLWHDSSVYYVLWAIWQSLGILMTHVVLHLLGGSFPAQAAKFMGPLSVLVWLTLTKPVVLFFLDCCWP